jgi:8-oxo-dGTP pyrophosphatase MutT (NUDIX family)
MADAPDGHRLPPHLPPRFAGGTVPLPPPLADLARDIHAGNVEPATPKHAATVVLMRDRPSGVEVFLLRRVSTMAFAAGMTVFPGGSVDPRDSELPPAAFAGCDLQQWSGLLDADPRLTGALVCAAVRETFEESGVMLAGPRADAIVTDTSGEDWELDRQALLARELSLSELLDRRGLVLRADLLRPWAHWITPELEPRRYDTRFFVAALPDGQQTRDVGGESDRVSWRRAAEALRAADAGEVGMLPPTAFTLAEISAYDSVAEVLAAGTARDIRPVLPRIVISGETAQLVLPHDADDA